MGGFRGELDLGYFRPWGSGRGGRQVEGPGGGEGEGEEELLLGGGYCGNGDIF